MKAAILVLAISVPAYAQVMESDADAKKSLDQFNKSWDKARDIVSALSQAVVTLSPHHHPTILKCLEEKFSEKVAAAPVRKEIAKAIGQYEDSDDAPKFLTEQLANFLKEKEKITFSALCAALSAIKASHTRPMVAKVNAYIEHKDTSLAVPAIQATGVIRHKSSVPLLIDRLEKLQTDMRTYIVGKNLKDCDHK